MQKDLQLARKKLAAKKKDVDMVATKDVLKAYQCDCVCVVRAAGRHMAQ